MCKHIAFVFLKVLKVDPAKGYHYQKGLLSSELEDIFSKPRLQDNSIMAKDRVKEAFRKASGGEVNNDPPPEKKRREIEGDCPICYDEMKPNGVTKEEIVEYCRECMHNFHLDCWEKWTSRHPNCPMCRVDIAVKINNSHVEENGEFLNFGKIQGMSGVRDTSSYKPFYRRERYYGDSEDSDNDSY